MALRTLRPQPVREAVLTRPARKYLTITTLAILLCGCTPEDGDINADPNAGTVQEQYHTLLKRPNIEQATDKYQRLLADIRTALRDHFDLPPWEHPDDTPIGAASCGFDFPDVRGDQGVTRTLKGGFTRKSIPEEEWSEALKLVTEVANQYGFKGPHRIADEPGNREVYYFDAAGSRFAFGQVNNISIGISTGCFLTPEAHRRGTPLPPSQR